MTAAKRSSTSVPKKRRVTTKRRSFTEQPLTEQAWRQLTSSLAEALSDMDEDEYLILSRKTGGGFVQFAAQGRHGMRAEAESNEFLPEDAQLSKATVDALLELGWSAPTYVRREHRRRADLTSPGTTGV